TAACSAAGSCCPGRTGRRSPCTPPTPRSSASPTVPGSVWSAARSIARASPAPSGPGRTRKSACREARSGRREARQVVDAERLLEARDVRDGVLEAVVAEERVLAFLELLAQLVVGLAAEELAEGGEEHGVLARGVRAVHALEGAQRARELVAVAVGGE